MNKLIYAAASLALLTGAMTSCSSDEPLPGNGNIAEKTETRYLKIRLVDANAGTRANNATPGEGYEAGTDAENKIKTLDFLFYNADGSFHSHKNANPNSATTPNQVTSPNNIEAIYETVVPIELTQGGDIPCYVTAVINAVDISSLTDLSMTECQKQHRTSLYGKVSDGDTKYFGMSNSVYYGVNAVTGQDNVLIMASPFETSKLITAEELSDPSGTNAPAADQYIDIYVERYAAKVKVSMDEAALNSTYTDPNTDIKLQFHPEAWRMNAYEKSFYFLKSFRTSASEQAEKEDPTSTLANQYASYDRMSEFIFDGWNNADAHRTFWAFSPAYYHTQFPTVTDDIPDDMANYPYSTYYHTYNDIKNNGVEFNQYEYVMESTVSQYVLAMGSSSNAGDNTMAGLPNVTIVGYYTIGDKTTPCTFYTYGTKNGKPVIYVDKAEDAVEGKIPVLKNAMISNQSVVFTYDSDKNEYIPVNNDNSFEIKHPDANVRKNTKVASRMVTLQLKGTNANYYYYNNSTRDYKKVETAADVDYVNERLFTILGTAAKYFEGKAMFSAPIFHYGAYAPRKGVNGVTAGTAAPYFNADGSLKPITDWEWENAQPGDFGVVRNHVYNINVGSMTGLGDAIGNPDIPIVPPMPTTNYKVNFRINIQKWAVLPVQNWSWN